MVGAGMACIVVALTEPGGHPRPWHAVVVFGMAAIGCFASAYSVRVCPEQAVRRCTVPVDDSSIRGLLFVWRPERRVASATAGVLLGLMLLYVGAAGSADASRRGSRDVLGGIGGLVGGIASVGWGGWVIAGLGRPAGLLVSTWGLTPILLPRRKPRAWDELTGITVYESHTRVGVHRAALVEFVSPNAHRRDKTAPAPSPTPTTVGRAPRWPEPDPARSRRPAGPLPTTASIADMRLAELYWERYFDVSAAQLAHILYLSWRRPDVLAALIDGNDQSLSYEDLLLFRVDADPPVEGTARATEGPPVGPQLTF